MNAAARFLYLKLQQDAPSDRRGTCTADPVEGAGIPSYGRTGDDASQPATTYGRRSIPTSDDVRETCAGWRMHVRRTGWLRLLSLGLLIAGTHMPELLESVLAVMSYGISRILSLMRKN
jgi:hypothetical protein